MGKVKDKSLDDILHKSIAKKNLVIEKIWDDIRESVSNEEPTDLEVKIIKKRLASYNQNPEKVKTWEEVKVKYL